jgi:hypothetical protein
LKASFSHRGSAVITGRHEFAATAGKTSAGVNKLPAGTERTDPLDINDLDPAPDLGEGPKVIHEVGPVSDDEAVPDVDEVPLARAAILINVGSLDGTVARHKTRIGIRVKTPNLSVGIFCGHLPADVLSSFDSFSPVQTQQTYAAHTVVPGPAQRIFRGFERGEIHNC